MNTDELAQWMFEALEKLGNIEGKIEGIESKLDNLASKESVPAAVLLHMKDCKAQQAAEITGKIKLTAAVFGGITAVIGALGGFLGAVLSR